MSSTVRAIKRAGCAAVLALMAVPLAGPIPAGAASVTVTSISPSAIGQGAQHLLVTVSGTGFQAGAVASASGTGVWLKGQVLSIPTTIYAYVTVSPGAATGLRSVTVTNPDGTSATCPGCLTIDAAPVLKSIGGLEAGAGRAGYFPVPVTLLGTGFVPGLSKTFINDPQSVFAIKNWSTQVVSASEAIAQLVVDPSTNPGNYDVTFTNGDGGLARCLGCFTVKPGPVVTSMTPNTFRRGHTYGVTLSGQYFDQGVLVAVAVLHGGITVSNVVVNNLGTKVTFDMAIASNVYLNSTYGILLYVINPAPGYGSIPPIKLTVTK